MLFPAFTADAMSRSLEGFLEKVSSSCVSFEYSFTMLRNGANVVGSGDVKVQDDSFTLNGNGLEIWCDGSTRWTIDRAAEEAVIETVEDADADYATNPALLITSVEKAFEEVSVGNSKFNGKQVSVSSLSPAEDVKSSTEISEIKLYFLVGTSSLCGLEVEMNDGSVCTFSIGKFQTSEKLSSKDSFRFDESSLDSSYIVTDLR